MPQIRAREIAEAIAAAAPTEGPGGMPIVKTRAYYDPAKIGGDEIRLNIYPTTRRKTRTGKNKTTETDFEIVIQRKTNPTDTAAIDQMVDFVDDLDALFETAGPMAEANYKTSEDTAYLWLPEELHRRNLFVAILPLTYQFSQALGT